MKKSDVPKPPMDVKSCAAFLGVSERDIKQMIRTGFLEAKKEGKLTLFDLTQVHTLRRTIQGGDKNTILRRIFEKYNMKLPRNYAFDRDATHLRRSSVLLLDGRCKER